MSGDVLTDRVLDRHSEEGWGVLASDTLPDTVVACVGQPFSQVVVVVALVGVELAGPAPAGPDRRYAFHERDRGLAVVDVGARDSGGQGQTGGGLG